MKKSLLALAVLGAFAGAASAQTSVTIYGVADIGIQRTDEDGANNTKWAVSSGQQSGSRIGFKGTEDLGGGLSAIFTLENGFSLDTGALRAANTLFNRQAWVGLNGGFGAVKAGRQYTPMHLVVDTIDPFATNLSGSMEPLFAAGSLFDGNNVVTNSVTYTTPDFNGFSAQAIYGFGEVAGSTSNSRQMGFSASYSNGPIYAAVAYHRANGGVAANAALELEDEVLPGTYAGLTDGGKATTLFAGGTYDFGVAKAHAAVAQDKVEFFGEDGKFRNYMLGVSAPVGAGKVFASWVRADDRGSEYKADQYAVGYSHGLSKRTNLYTSFGYTQESYGPNDANRNSSRFGRRPLTK